MPIYEYRCKDCHQVFEEWRKQPGDETLNPCPICRGSSERLLSASSFVLKGGGWYATEYGNRKQNGDECGATTVTETAPVAEVAPPPAPAPSADSGSV